MPVFDGADNRAMTTTKSPRRLLVEAHAVSAEALPAYGHRKSPHRFTQPQLFACLVLKAALGLDYRGLAALLEDASDLREAIGLRWVPHYTTFQKAAHRLLTSPSAQALLDATVARAVRLGKLARRPALVAVDSSGFESRHVSRYFARRRQKTGPDGRPRKVVYRRYPKLGLAVDCASHLVLAAVAGQGPSPDFGLFRPLLEATVRRVRPRAVLADAGFDSEAGHAYCRETLGIRSLIPACHGRPSCREPTTRYRRAMARHLGRSRYGQRWQVETAFSMIKRALGEVVDARTYWRRCRLMMLMALTHNIRILRPFLVFSTEHVQPIFLEEHLSRLR